MWKLIYKGDTINNTQIQLVKLLNKSLVKEKIDIDKNINLSELI